MSTQISFKDQLRKYKTSQQQAKQIHTNYPQTTKENIQFKTQQNTTLQVPEQSLTPSFKSSQNTSSESEMKKQNINKMLSKEQKEGKSENNEKSSKMQAIKDKQYSERYRNTTQNFWNSKNEKPKKKKNKRSKSSLSNPHVPPNVSNQSSPRNITQRFNQERIMQMLSQEIGRSGSLSQRQKIVNKKQNLKISTQKSYENLFSEYKTQSDQILSQKSQISKLQQNSLQLEKQNFTLKQEVRKLQEELTKQKKINEQQSRENKAKFKVKQSSLNLKESQQVIHEQVMQNLTAKFLKIKQKYRNCSEELEKFKKENAQLRIQLQNHLEDIQKGDFSDFAEQIICLRSNLDRSHSQCMKLIRSNMTDNLNSYMKNIAVYKDNASTSKTSSFVQSSIENNQLGTATQDSDEMEIKHLQDALRQYGMDIYMKKEAKQI